MGEHFDRIPDDLKRHVKEITKTSGLPDTEESLEKIAEAWLEKRKVFEEKTRNLKLEEVRSLGADEDRGALAPSTRGPMVSREPE